MEVSLRSHRQASEDALPVFFCASLLDADIAGLQAKHLYAIIKLLFFVRAARPPAAANEMMLRKDL